MKKWLPLLLLLLTATSVAGAEPRLSITASLARRDFGLGEPIELKIIYRNAGDVAFFLERPKGVGPDHLNVVASRGIHKFETEPFYGCRDINDFRFIFLALLPGESLETSMIFNDPSSEGFLYFPITESGEYQIDITLTSKGPTSDHGFEPIWRGVVSASPVLVDLKVPNAETLEAWRLQLASCLQSGEPWTCEAVHYFTIVPDPAATSGLIAFLTKWPNFDFAARALYLTKTKEASEFLGQLAEWPSVDKELRPYYKKLAAKMAEAEEILVGHEQLP